jgi:molybdopterin synthase sulfur carrier subunit
MITVKFFASLREQIGHAEDSLENAAPLTVREVWQRCCGGRAMPANTLSAINREYAGLDTPVQDGDEVAFFPPVTGG